MKKNITTFVCVLAFNVTGLLAQSSTSAPNPANFAQHRVSFLTTLLSLSTAQQQQATTIFSNEATAEASVHSSMQTARQTLKTAVQANDTATIEQTATTIGNLTAQTTANEAKADAAFYQVLTPAQQTKLTQFEGQGHGRMMGRGGPGRF